MRYGVEVSAGLVEKIDTLDDISVCNTVQVRDRLVVLVFLSHRCAVVLRCAI